MTESIIKEIIVILSDLFNIRPEELGPDSSPDNVESWDSLQNLNLVLDIEQRFNITLMPSDVEAFANVQSITNIIKKKMEKT